MNTIGLTFVKNGVRNVHYWCEDIKHNNFEESQRVFIVTPNSTDWYEEKPFMYDCIIMNDREYKCKTMDDMLIFFNDVHVELNMSKTVSNLVIEPYVKDV